MARDLIPLDVPKVPPRRFRIWRAGANPGDYGTNNVTAGAVARVMVDYEKRGTALVIDVEHALNAEKNPDLDPAAPPTIGGYAELRTVDTAAGPELWADPVRWSDCGRPFAAPGAVCCGKHQITTGQRGYISPDWLLDPETREPTILNRLSLVAEPGTYGINLLAARAAAPRRTATMNDMEILKALLAAAAGAASSADPDVQSLGAAVSQSVGDLASKLGVDLSAAPASEPAPAPAAAGADMDEKIEKAVASAVSRLAGKLPVAASKGVDLATVHAVARAESERSRILEANKEVLGDMLPLLASKPLDEVKSFIAAVASKASKGADGAAPNGGPVTGAPETSKSYSLADRYSKGK